MPQKKEENHGDSSGCHTDGRAKPAEERENTESESGEKEMFEKFEQELKWCVWKLEKQLSSKNLNRKQAEQTTKTLKSLINPKSTLIKKRVLMRSVFGDYRKLMKDEEKKFERNVKEMVVTQIEPSDLQGTFYRKSSSTVKPNHSLEIAKSNSSFKFNFVTSIENDEEDGHK